jgi:hypothetical protein
MGGLLLLCPLVLQAATLQAPPVSDQELVRQLLERVERLEAQVRELEAQRAAPAVGETGPARDEANPAARSAPGVVPAREPAPPMAMPATVEAGEFPNLRFQGFSDVGWGWSNASGDHNAFGLGQFNLFITSTLSSRLSVVAEPVVEADQHNEFGIELERLLLQMALSPYFNVSVGRYHTAVGWYNTAYHHSSWLQTAIGRPFLFEFEDNGGILPIHNVGISATGRIPSGALNLRYIAEVGNGRASRSPLDEPVQSVTDENAGKAVNVALLMRPDGLRGFQAGVSVYHDRLTPARSSEIDQTIIAGHAVYQSTMFEWLNEGLVIRNTDRDTGRLFSTPGFYTQIARQFWMVKPYVRYQWVDAPPDDPYYADVGRMFGPSIGVRYDFSQLGAFKIQYDHTSRRGAAAINGVTTQLSFAF